MTDITQTKPKLRAHNVIISASLLDRLTFRFSTYLSYIVQLCAGSFTHQDLFINRGESSFSYIP